jgi:D-alanine--D-alanine ligase
MENEKRKHEDKKTEGRDEKRKTEHVKEVPERKKIAVIFGGCSPEYGVSLQSAYAVVSHIDREKYEPVLIGISPEGAWYRFQGDAEKIESDTWCNGTDCIPAAVSPDRRERCLLLFEGERVRKMHIDAAFPVLHGRNGEDGTVQGMLELAGIPVAGCGTLASALCMDKERAHKLAAAEGIRIPKSFVVGKNADMGSAAAKADEIGYPLFVKPVKAGSSYGVTKVSEAAGLPEALTAAFAYDEKAIVEEGITGFEVGCAVMGEDVLTVGEVDEIELSDGFFDFEEKYTLKTSSIHVPARIPAEKAEEIKRTAQKIYRALDCRGFARVDLFLSDTGEIVFNEVNTIPGFTAHSRFPNMMKAAGISFGQIIASAIERAVSL